MGEERLAKKREGDKMTDMSEERLAKKREGDKMTGMSEERLAKNTQVIVQVISATSAPTEDTHRSKVDEREGRQLERATIGVRKERSVNWKALPALDLVIDDMQPINIDPMSIDCRHCGALFWRNENKWCCNAGKINFGQGDLSPPVPNKLIELLSTNSTEAKHFRDSIRQFNASLAITSMGTDEAIMKGASKSENSIPGRGPCVLTVYGELRHR